MTAKMCQTCWVTPAKERVLGADGRRRWKCNGCLQKREPKRPQTARESLAKKIFSKDTI